MKGHWAGKPELGSALGMRLLFEVSRRLGRLPFRISLLPVVLYFFLSQPSKRRASREYLERLRAYQGGSGRVSAWAVFRHFLVSGEGILERILAWDPKSRPPSFRRHGREAVARHLESGRGVLLIGSHLGNMEVARHLALSERKVPVTVLVHTKHNPRFMALMKRINPASQASLLQVTDMSPVTAMVLKGRIDAGEVILIAGDRVPVEGKGVAWVPFLNHPAPLPIGPYVLASVLECPVFLFFCLGRGGAYDIHYEAFAEKVELERATRRRDLAALAGRYAERLSYYCTQAPLLWGNIYGFWGDPEVGGP